MKCLAKLALPEHITAGCQATPSSQGSIHGIVFDLDKTLACGGTDHAQRGKDVLNALTDGQGRFTFSKNMYETRSWPLTVSDFMDAIYLQTSNPIEPTFAMERLHRDWGRRGGAGGNDTEGEPDLPIPASGAGGEAGRFCIRDARR